MLQLCRGKELQQTFPSGHANLAALQLIGIFSGEAEIARLGETNDRSCRRHGRCASARQRRAADQHPLLLRAGFPSKHIPAAPGTFPHRVKQRGSHLSPVCFLLLSPEGEACTQACTQPWRWQLGCVTAQAFLPHNMELRWAALVEKPQPLNPPSTQWRVWI